MVPAAVAAAVAVVVHIDNQEELAGVEADAEAEQD